MTGLRAKTPLLGLLLCLGFTLAACATAPDDDTVNDPLEPMNRGIFTFNQALDKMLFRPAAELYHALMPPPARTAVSNALENLGSPLVLVHDLLQGEGDRAGTTATRFAINSTVGLLGFGDPATDMGFPGHKEDLGQTLGAWGGGEGPYLMLPVLGPSNPRDALGKLGDMFIDPMGILASNTGNADAALGRTAGDGMDTRVEHLDTLDQMERTSVDFYAALRSAYRQRRASLISNGQGPAALPPGPLLDPEEPAAAPKPETRSEPPAAIPPIARPAAPAAPIAAAKPAAKTVARPAVPTAPAAAAKSAPKPVAAVAPAPAAPREARLHLGSFPNHEEALRGWEAYADRFGDSLDKADPTFSEVALGSQTYIRLIAAFPDAAGGMAACDALQAGNAYCRMLN